MQVCPSCGEDNPPRFRLCGFCGAPLAAALPAQEVRKIVTVVFSDLKGSTALGEHLDPESLREVLTRYFDGMRASLESHGGTVEKYIGDAVMAVFGLPRVHEDDALRAVRAALEMQTTLERLNDEFERDYGVRLTNRTGVATGEVVAGNPSAGQRLVTGDIVNVAARLEQASPANEILIGGRTHQLVRDAVAVEEVEPLELKGKSERVPAYRLLGLAGARTGRASDRAFVAREAELHALRSALDEAAATRTARLATIVGDPGIGKSRLTEALVAAAGPDTRLVRGRCLPYGRGITFWPLVEVVREAAAIDEADPPETARAKLAALVVDHPEVAERVASAIGLSATEFPLDEITWGTRKLMETLAADGPTIMVVDDVHWAEDAFLDLIEQLVSGVQAPLLVLCATRRELLDRRPSWSSEAGSVRVELEPLSPADTERMIDGYFGEATLAEAARQRIVEVAEGNPLFLEQLLSMLVDEGVLERRRDEWRPTVDLSRLAIPATIHALLAARLELLEPEERAVLEPASVIGVEFPQEAVEALAPEGLGDRIASLLSGLVDKQFVRYRDGERSFRFQHILIRDTVYAGVLKRNRASLHERFADWAEVVNRERNRETEYEEILGYHLEQAHGYRSALGPVDDHGRTLGARAAEHLGSAGRRAFGRGDMVAAADLLRRAVALLPELSRGRIELLPDLAEALQEIGEFRAAETFVEDAVAGARELGDATLEADAILTRLLVRHHAADDLDAWRAEVERETTRIIQLVDGEAAPDVLAKAWRMVGFVHGTVCRWEETAVAAQQTVEYARAAGDLRREARAAAALSMALCLGPTPAPQAIARLDEILESGLADGQAQAVVLLSLARLHAMEGRFDEARQLGVHGARHLDDRGGGVIASATSIAGRARVELLAGRVEAAEEQLREDYERLTEMDERYFRPLVAAVWAQALAALGRLDDAEAAASAAAELSGHDDVETEAVLHCVRARLVAARGDPGLAVTLAERGVSLVRTTDAPVMQADALVDLAEVLQLAGREVDAAAAAAEARLRYGLKGHVVGAARADALLASLGGRAARAADAHAADPVA
jgi:class 3 adenylate cyclase/tetratricopeptide (TPR) repeat protein